MILISPAGNLIACLSFSKPSLYQSNHFVSVTVRCAWWPNAKSWRTWTDMITKSVRQSFLESQWFITALLSWIFKRHLQKECLSEGHSCIFSNSTVLLSCIQYYWECNSSNNRSATLVVLFNDDRTSKIDTRNIGATVGTEEIKLYCERTLTDKRRHAGQFWALLFTEIDKSEHHILALYLDRRDQKNTVSIRWTKFWNVGSTHVGVAEFWAILVVGSPSQLERKRSRRTSEIPLST